MPTMSSGRRLLVAGILLLGAQAAPARAAEHAAPTPPDLTAGGEKDKSHDWLLGPTGLRGWMFYHEGRTTHARQILVTAVDAGSPADGILAVGDVILGAAGKRFDGDPRIQLADAITAAETEQGGGVLRLTRWRAGTTDDVEIKLAVLGTYAATAPYDCPKSRAIFERGCARIAAGGLKSGDGLAGVLNMLALLASGNEEHRPLLAEYARKLAASMKGGQHFHGWNHSYANLFLAEYVLATGDKELLAELERTTMDAVEAQSTYGTWGHGGRKPSGNCSGYGAMNQVGLPMTVSLVLAREAGVADPALDRAIDKSVNFLRWYVDKGAIPYGVHPAWTQSHDDNGKSSLAAVLFDLVDDREAVSFFARMGTAAYDEREQGHCGNWFNMMWALPGVSRCGPLATGAYLKEQRWYYELARNWKGGFEYQKVNPHDENNNYTSWDLTGTYLLSFGLPLESLRVTGKKSSAPPLDAAEAASVIAAGRDAYPVNGRDGYADRSTEELLAGLASWSPVVRNRSAKALAARQEDCLPAVLTLLDGPDRLARYGACEALACLGPRADPAAPRLRALLADPDPWMQSLASNAIRFLGPEERQASVNDLLRMAATPNPADPRRTNHLAAGLSLFCGYPGVGGPTLLGGSIEGVDRTLLYPAIRSLLDNDDSVARGGPGAVYAKLTDRDLAELLPAIVKAAPDQAPTNEMFADGPRLPAFDLLSRHHIREGMTMIENALNGDRWGGDVIPMCLDYLRRYGVHAKEVLPRLKLLEMIRKRWGPQVEAIEHATETPELVSLEEFIAKRSAATAR